MKTTRQCVMPFVVMVFLGVTFSVASGQNPLPCTHPAPDECIPYNAVYDDDLDGTCNEDNVDGIDNDHDGSTDEDPYPPMCDWKACSDTVGGPCSNYTLKYFRSADLLTQNNNITRAVIAVHGRRNHRSSVDDRPIDYYFHIRNAASDLNLLNSTLIIAPFFDEPKKCPVDTNNQCVQGAADVDNPRCGPAGDRLCWDVNVGDYPAGGNASNDDHLWTASFSLLDDMINTLAHLKATGIFPNLDTIVVTGQSAGGQFTLRYAMAGAADPAGIAIRYVACNPGGVTYLNAFRPMDETKEAFPNIGYERDCDEDGTNEDYMAPGVTDVLADTNDWKNYPPYFFEIPHWDGGGGYWGDCITDGSYDNWPWGISDVSTANDYLANRVGTAAALRARYLKRQVVVLAAIDDNFYVSPAAYNYETPSGTKCGAPEGASEWNCMHALQGNGRVERSALFYKHVCVGFDCINHAFETVCIDNNGDGACDFTGDYGDNITIPCIVDAADGTCDRRLGHGGGIYGSDVARLAVFYGLKPTPVETQWGKTVGGFDWDRAVAVELTPDGGYIVLGETNSYGAGGMDFWVVKLNEEGTVLWQKTYGGEEDDRPAALTTSPDGGYLLAGETSSNASGEADAWLVHIDENGDLIWARNYGDDLEDGAIAVVTTADDCYLVAGNSAWEDNYAALYKDAWVMKLTRTGEKLWRKTFDATQIDTFSSLEPTLDGGCIVAGNVIVRNQDFWVLKLDRDGNIQYKKIYGMNAFGLPAGTENSEYPPHVVLAHDGGYLLAGLSNHGGTASGVIWMLKLGEDLSITWQKMIESDLYFALTSVQSTTDGGFIFSGKQIIFFPPPANRADRRFVMKLDANGDPQWTSGYGASYNDWIHSVKQTRDGGYIAVGATETYSFGASDLWVLKLSKNGELPDCPAIQSLSYSAEEGPPEGPEDLGVTVDSTMPGTRVWTVTVTDPPSEDLFEGNGCTKAWDSVNLPRTGQMTAYHAGDDGSIQAGVAWPSPRFLDSGDGTITDQLTGLTWLKDAHCLGSSSWGTALDSVKDFNTNPETFSCADYDTENPKDDWRLPNIHELESLTNPAETSQVSWLNGEGFVSVQPRWYWSSSTPSVWYRRWAVSMTHGRPSYGASTSATYWIWPVRGGQKGYADPAYPANVPATDQAISRQTGDDGDLQMGVAWHPSRFLDNGDGTITDMLTGLVWLKDSHCFKDTTTFQINSWEDGLDAIADFNIDPGAFNCAEYDVGKHQADWRMPNLKEFWSLMHRSKVNPALPDGHPFLNVDTDGRIYWTSTTYNRDNAWYVDPMSTGNIGHMIKSHGQPTVWPVRGVTTCYGDCDQDGDVDGLDLGAFLSDFTAHNPDGTCQADFNRDGLIDEQDLARFADCFGRANCRRQ